MKKIEIWAVACFLIGAISLVASVITSGIQYRIAEDAGKEDLTAPTWIVAWHGISILIGALGLLILVYWIVATWKEKPSTKN